MTSVFSLDNPLLRTYVFYMAVLGLKMLVMSILTGLQRHKKGAFANPEDSKMKNVKPRVDEDVERVRRAHRNDLENIPVFMFISLLYVLSEPNAFVASMLIRVFTGARIMHTVAYVFLASHKLRGMGWGIGYLITIFMGVSLIISSIQYF